MNRKTWSIASDGFVSPDFGRPVSQILFCLALLGAVTPLPLTAQNLGIRPGAHSGVIEGEIFVKSEASAAPHRVTVELTSRQLGFREKRYVSQGQGFEFRGLHWGVYQLRASCSDHRPVEKSVTVTGSLRGEVVRVRLEMGEPIGERAQEGPLTVSVAHLGIPPKALAALKKAGQASRKGDYSKAVQHLRRAVRHHPDFGEAYNNLAVAYLRLGEHEKAMAAAEKAIAINQLDGVAHGNLGMIHLSQGDLLRAKTLLSRSVELGSSRPAVRLQLAAVSMELGDFMLAGDSLLAVWNQTRKPDDLLLRAAGCYFRAGEISRSESLVERFSRLHPGDPRPAVIRRLLRDQPEP